VGYEETRPVEASTGCRRKHQMAVCVNVHCSLNGADDLVEHLVVAHGVAPDVDSERGLSLELTYCFGACDMGPNVEVDGEFYDGVTPEQIDRIISGLE
jgi:NADH:ubiquinone oxidoreductase subunit E